MARSEKEATVQEITQILTRAKGVFVTDFQGLNVAKISELRSRCRKASVEYVVVKNTLARIAARNAGWQEMEGYFKGPSAIAYSFDDPSAPARIIAEFAKGATDKPSFKVSVFEGVFYGPEKVKVIATLPSKNELVAKMLGSLNSPLVGLAGVLSGLLSKLARTVDAVREKQSKSESVQS